MSKVDLTPAKLAEWKKELRRSIDEQVPLPRCLNTKNMLAMVEEIERLRGLQCWVIMRKDNRDHVFDGPFFTEEDARLHVLESVVHEYTVETWVNQANVRESEAEQ